MTDLTLERRRGLVPPRVVDAQDAAARKRKAQPIPAAPVGGPHPLNTVGGQPVPPATDEPGMFGQIVRGLRIGTQGQGEMIGDILGAPGDIARRGRDAINAGGRDLSNAAFGEEGGAAFRDQLGNTPAGRVAASVGDLLAEALPTSEHLQTGFGDTLRSFGLGGAIIPEANMTPRERIGKEANRFGAGAVIGSTGSLRAAGTKLGETLAGKILLRRYHRALENRRPGRKLAFDSTVGSLVGAAKERGDQVREGLTTRPEDQGRLAQALQNAADDVTAMREGDIMRPVDTLARAMERMVGPDISEQVNDWTRPLERLLGLDRGEPRGGPPATAERAAERPGATGRPLGR